MKTRYFIILVILMGVFAIRVNAEQTIFTKTWDSQVTKFGKTNYNALYKMDNLAFGDTVLTISFTHENEIDDSKCQKDYCLVIKQYGKDGRQINELYLQNVINYISPVVIDNYLYIVTNYGDKETACNVFSIHGTNIHDLIDCTSNFNSYIEKYDSSLKKVSSLRIDKNFDAFSFNSTNKMNAMFVGSYCYGMPSGFIHYISDGTIIDGMNCELIVDAEGHDRVYPEDYYNNTVYEYYDFYQIHEENGKIVIWTVEEDIVVDKNLTNVITRDNSWISKYGDGSDYSFGFVDKGNYLVSGYEMVGDSDADGFIKLLNNDIEVFNYRTNKYYSLYFPIKVNEYYLALGQAKSGDYQTEIIVLDSKGELVQTIRGNFWNLRAVKNGFAVTNLKASLGEYMMNESGTQNVYTEVYNMFIVETKTDGNGEISFVRSNIDGVDTVEFTVIPKKGYVLGSVKVTDAKGNTVELNDNTFTMPSANVLIEATFVPVNPNTGTFISVGVIGLLIISLIITMLFYKKRKALLN